METEHGAKSVGYEGWSIVEVMGHKRLAGYVSEQAIAGGALVRVDVPATPADSQHGRPCAGTEAYTQLIGVASIYRLTPCTEEVARRSAREIERHNDPLPVQLPKQLAAGSGDPRADAQAELDEDLAEEGAYANGNTDEGDDGYVL